MKPAANCPAGDPNVRVRAETRIIELISRGEKGLGFRLHAHIRITNVSADPVFVLDSFWARDIGTERTQLDEIKHAAKVPHAVIVSGLRRVGKSTLLAQMAHKLGREAFYYVNFEDNRFLGFQPEDPTISTKPLSKRSVSARSSSSMKSRVSPAGSILSAISWT
jgi:hypothetical protein